MQNSSSSQSRTAVSSAIADDKKINSRISDSLKKEKEEYEGIIRLEKAPKKIEESAINLIPKEVSEKYKIVAFEKKGNLVKIAMVNPKDIMALNALRFVAEKENVELDVYLVSQEIFREIIEQYSSPAEALKEAVQSFKKEVIFDESEEEKSGKIEKQSEVLKDAPVTKLVEVIIGHAVEGSASDIHIEPMDKDYRVRFRVDGILHVSLIMPKEIGPAVISRIKILANLKIDEKRKPQDGRFRTISEGKEIDFRVSTLPVISGEKIVMRILDKDQGLASIEALGLFGTALENVKKAIQETYGMILFTGPTGSGKSTSLYALLKILNSEERNIITLEDPIEYNIEGLNQSQIKPEIGYTFASGLRTILRQDPNVIMVGEIRDSETAELAVHAALTGHLMFSTLHTNTATGAIPRLIDMGIEPFLLASSIRIVVAQRLVRKICEKCKEEKKVPDSVREAIKKEITGISENEFKKYGIDPKKEIKFFHGKGCDECNGTGLRGRLAIYEAVPANENIRNIITEKRGSDELIRKEREDLKILTIKQDGILKIIKGMTTIEEVDRVTEGNMALEEEND
ncbi:MAG TPA: GspE/PulE family protein [Candidatus Moranbacteria bacterium]|nr:GspE/PulE family protein [Candidatus Moranbacteria bacterium]